MTAAMAAPITRRRCGRCGGTEQNYDLMELIQFSLIKSVSANFLFAFIFENYSATEPFLLKLSIDLLAKGSGGEGHERKPSGSFLQSE